MSITIYNANLITPYRVVYGGGVVVEEEKIFGVFEGSTPDMEIGSTCIDAKGLYLSPGFIEIHTHGAGNADFMDGSVDAVCQACRTHLQYGTTSIIPTTLTSDYDELVQNMANIEAASKIGDCMPEILGIHLEGPYFSMSQKGAQDSRYIKNPDPLEYKRILEASSMVVRWTVAPELPGALEMGRFLAERGIVMSIGHSNAVYDQVIKACEYGYTLVTHVFLGMSRLTRINARMYLGVAESSLLIDDLAVEVIADGRHLPTSLLKLIYKNKGSDRICLVTDSMRAAGLDVNRSIIGSQKNGQEVEIEDGVAYMPGRQSFGGSVATADRLVRTMVMEAEVPLMEAIKMFTITPAKVMGIEHRKGSLTAGKEADLVLFDQDINIKFVMVRGNVWLNKISQ